MPIVRAEAPGKAILIGEHSVVYGHPAIAIPVKGVSTVVEAEATEGAEIEVILDGGFSTSARSGSDVAAKMKELVHSLAERLDAERLGVRVTVRSTIPVARGLGSSAAVSVATIRALSGLLGRELTDMETADLAYDAEKLFHGSPSGIDNNVIARGVPIYYVKGKSCSPIEPREAKFRFLIADTGVPSETAAIVAEVREARERRRAHYDALFWEIGTLACVAREVIRRGGPPELGMCMNRNHELLKSLGVSSEGLDSLVIAAVKGGAAGAKLSGAGRGGNVLALLEDPDSERQVEDALREEGATSIISTEL